MRRRRKSGSWISLGWLAGAAAVVLAAASCTSLLGLDGDYVLDPAGGAGGTGGTAASQGPGSGTTGAAEGGGDVIAASSATQGSAGGGGAGTTGPGGGGGPAVDCDDLLCVPEVPIENRPPGARNPRLTQLPQGRAALTFLYGDESYVWVGSTEGEIVTGGVHETNTTADDAVALTETSVLLLQNGAVNVNLASEQPIAFQPPIFGALGIDESTFFVAGHGMSSPVVRCPEAGACGLDWDDGEPVSAGAPAHALAGRGAFVVAARACGDERELQITRNGELFRFPDRAPVVQVAVATPPTPDAVALTVDGAGSDTGRVVLSSLSTGGDPGPSRLIGRQQVAVPGVAVEVTLLSEVHAVWGDGDGDDQHLVVAVCPTGLPADCVTRRLHLVDAPPPVRPRRPSLVAISGAMLLAWEEGDGGNTTVRVARLPQNGLP